MVPFFQPILKLIEPEGNSEEKIFNSEVSQAMGIHTNDFDEIKGRVTRCGYFIAKFWLFL